MLFLPQSPDILEGSGLRSDVATEIPVAKLDRSLGPLDLASSDNGELTDSQRFPPGGPMRAIASDFIGATATEHEFDQGDP
jgi:hypothetical protein